MPIERIQWDKQDVVTCDDRGRATLGKEFANEQVYVYIAEIDIPETNPVSDEEQSVLSDMAVWADENVDEYIDLDARSGVVTDKYGEEYQSPYSIDQEVESDE